MTDERLHGEVAHSTSGMERTDTTPNGNPVYEYTGDDGAIVAIPEGGEVYIPVVMSGEKTGLSDLVSAVVDELGNNKLVFANVLNPELKSSLDGFEEEKEYAPNYGEYVTVLRGEWDD